jgi:hypothetical protein
VAAKTIPVLTHPSFPQVFKAAISSLVTPPTFPSNPTSSVCCYEYPETTWGACDGQPCRRVAVVHDVATEMDYCALHYREVPNGR